MRININKKRKYVELVVNGGDAIDRQFIEMGDLKCSVGQDDAGNITNIMIVDTNNLLNIKETYLNMEDDDGFEKESY